MGAWANGIFDNDSAGDVLCGIEAIIGHPPTRQSLDGDLPALLEAMPGEGHATGHSTIVLCAVVMEAGAEVTEDLRQATVAALAGCDYEYFFPEARASTEPALKKYHAGKP